MKIRPREQGDGTWFDVEETSGLEQWQRLLRLLGTVKDCAASEAFFNENAGRGALIEFRGRRIVMLWNEKQGASFRANGDVDRAAAEDLAGFLAATGPPGRGE